MKKLSKEEEKEILDVANSLIAELQTCKDGLIDQESYDTWGKVVIFLCGTRRAGRKRRERIKTHIEDSPRRQ